ncbi:CDP-alcohol phosphatidyltransferase-domain-containing protein [Zopfochytrium polystomum]|nr:CDP-alcohol phosphatidyltransferase-domain-containing protein [Zopfochytrium polystomum]
MLPPSVLHALRASPSAMRPLAPHLSARLDQPPNTTTRTTTPLPATRPLPRGNPRCRQSRARPLHTAAPPSSTLPWYFRNALRGCPLVLNQTGCLLPLLGRSLSSVPPSPGNNRPAPPPASPKAFLPKRVESIVRENIYTIPNILTMTRIAMTPAIGYLIAVGHFQSAFAVLAVAAVTDVLDGLIARGFNQKTSFGSILDPAADKILMTVLTVSLSYSGLLPTGLAVLIIGRDVGLTAAVFVYRYISLPAPKTWTRYWDASIPTAEVRPPLISKLNTFLQLGLMASTLSVAAAGYSVSMLPLEVLRWTVCGTTVASALVYWFDRKNLLRLNNKI